MVLLNTLGLTVSLEQLSERAACLREELGATATEQSLDSQGEYADSAMHLTESVVWCPKMNEILQAVEDAFPPPGAAKVSPRHGDFATSANSHSNPTFTSELPLALSSHQTLDKRQVQVDAEQPSQISTIMTPPLPDRSCIATLETSDQPERPQSETEVVQPGLDPRDVRLVQGRTVSESATGLPWPPLVVSRTPEPSPSSKPKRAMHKSQMLVQPLCLYSSDLRCRRDDDDMPVDATRAGYELAQFLRSRGFGAMHVLPNLGPPLPDVGSMATTVLVKLAASVIYNAIDMALSVATTTVQPVAVPAGISVSTGNSANGGTSSAATTTTSTPHPGDSSSSRPVRLSICTSVDPGACATQMMTPQAITPLARLFVRPAAASFSAAGRALSATQFEALARGDGGSLDAALEMLDHLPRVGAAPSHCRGVVFIVDALDSAERPGDRTAAAGACCLEVALRRLAARESALLVFTLSNDDSMVGRWPDK